MTRTQRQELFLLAEKLEKRFNFLKLIKEKNQLSPQQQTFVNRAERWTELFKKLN